MSILTSATDHVLHPVYLVQVIAPPMATELGSELDQYLQSDIQHVIEPIAWWHKNRASYPQLSQMAIDYLAIPDIHFCQCLLIGNLLNTF